MRTRRKQIVRVMVVLSPIHAALTGLTWRDLSRRNAALVRGPKGLWRAASLLNPLGAIGYWTIGRMRSPG